MGSGQRRIKRDKVVYCNPLHSISRITFSFHIKSWVFGQAGLCLFLPADFGEMKHSLQDNKVDNCYGFSWWTYTAWMMLQTYILLVWHLHVSLSAANVFPPHTCKQKPVCMDEYKWWLGQPSSCPGCRSLMVISRGLSRQGDRYLEWIVYILNWSCMYTLFCMSNCFPESLQQRWRLES